MSKQLSISATFAVLSMAVLAAIAGLGGFSGEETSHRAGTAPLVEMNASR